MPKSHRGTPPASPRNWSSKKSRATGQGVAVESDCAVAFGAFCLELGGSFPDLAVRHRTVCTWFRLPLPPPTISSGYSLRTDPTHPHFPSTQFCPLAHLCPQPPQLSGSIVRFRQPFGVWQHVSPPLQLPPPLQEHGSYTGVNDLHASPAVQLSPNPMVPAHEHLCVLRSHVPDSV